MAGIEKVDEGLLDGEARKRCDMKWSRVIRRGFLINWDIYKGIARLTHH